MAWFADIVRDVVAVVHDLTVSGGVEVTVTHLAYVSQDILGAPIYAAPVTRTCVMRDIKHNFYTDADREVQPQHELIFTGNVPIDPRDAITMPDGNDWPILEVSGLADAEQGGRYFTIVKLGQDYIRLQHRQG